MEKCKSYKVTKQIVGWCNSQQPIHKNVYRCNGTKERDVCSCGGDPVRCDFYPEVREKAKIDAKKRMTNAEYIRSLTDEELAEFLVLEIPGDICDWPDLMLEWLKEPTE